MIDQRRLISSKRPRVPAVAFITTLNATFVAVEKSVETPQIRRMPGTTKRSGSSSEASAARPKAAWLPMRPRLYHGTTLRRVCMNAPIGIARSTPVSAGSATSRLTSRFVAPSRTRNTGRKTPPELITPISADSRKA